MAVSTTKIKKKRWVTIIAPKILGERPIGDSYVVGPEELVGRIIPCNLSVLTNDNKSQNITMKFLIKEIKDGNAITEPKEYILNPSFLKRLMRRKRERIDESLHVKTSDGKGLRIKIFLLTNSAAKGSVKKLIRRRLKEELSKILEKNTFSDIFEGVISNKMQKDLKLKLNKTFPLKTVEIKALKEEKEKVKTAAKKEEKEKEEKEKDKKEEKQEENKEKPKKKKTKKSKTKKNAKTSN